MSKSVRTIKKSAAKSSVSRKTLRSAVKKTSSAAKKSSWSAAKKSGHSAKKGASVAKRGTAKKGVKESTGSHAGGSKMERFDQYLHQPSIIRPATSGTWTSLRNLFGSKDR